jgi:hypothetical protein
MLGEIASNVSEVLLSGPSAAGGRGTVNVKRSFEPRAILFNLSRTCRR